MFLKTGVFHPLRVSEPQTGNLSIAPTDPFLWSRLLGYLCLLSKGQSKRYLH